MIYTAPHEFFFTRSNCRFLPLCFFLSDAGLPALPLCCAGLYRNERGFFCPFSGIAHFIYQRCGAGLFFIMPLALAFFQSMEILGTGGTDVRMLNRVRNIFPSPWCDAGLWHMFPVAVVLTLLGRAGIITADDLRRRRRYAIVLAFATAALLTPPDPVSQIGLGVPILVLYEISIFSIAAIQKRPRKAEFELMCERS